MNPNYTDITVVLDRSGSMSTIVPDVIGGYNTFVEDQKKNPNKVVFSLIQFDDQYEVVYQGVNLEHVKPLDTTTFVPRGWTALHDAIGRTVNDIGARLAKMPESERPGRVIVMIITDGEENKSQEFTQSQIKEMIERQQGTYNWQFMFLASNQDAITKGQDYGFVKGRSLSMGAGGQHMRSAMRSASQAVYSMSCVPISASGDLELNTVGHFSSADRDAQGVVDTSGTAAQDLKDAIKTGLDDLDAGRSGPVSADDIKTAGRGILRSGNAKP